MHCAHNVCLVESPPVVCVSRIVWDAICARAVSPAGCLQAVGTQSEPSGRYCEPARPALGTEWEPTIGAVCKPTARYLQAATPKRRMPHFSPPPQLLLFEVVATG
jgi:hypothetical protein